MKIQNAVRNFSSFANIGSRIAYVVFIAASVFLLAGFVRFTSVVAQYGNSIDTGSDGIVVLTGGKSRIDVALGLLHEGYGKRLLISGVHPNTSTAALSSQYPGRKGLFSCCVDIDRVAHDTIQNGRETAKWAQKQGFKNLIVVTSDYHMPRGMLELSRAMPDKILVPYVASGKTSTRRAGVNDTKNLRMMVMEFMKTIASSLNL